MGNLQHGQMYVAGHYSYILANQWMKFRSELGDTLPWFRAVQGGIYHKDGLAWGVLVDRDSGERSYIDEEVVITRM